MLLLPLSLVACIENSFSVSDGVDVYIQNPAEQVDILMIVDNSCSMEPYQKKLGTNFDSFIEYFVGANVDYHIGITTTDNSVAKAGHIIGDVITPETADPSAAFNDAVNVGIANTSGASLEMGLETGLKAITAPRTENANKGFLRPDASLSLIIVSDEEDSSPLPVNDYINEFYAVKGQRVRDVFNFSALTVTDESVCTADQAAASSPGDRYVDVARQTHGLVGNLCETGSGFSSIITDLSLNASRLQDTYFLTGKPNPSTLSVSVKPEGAEVEENLTCDSGAWTYDLIPNDDGIDSPAVIFNRDNLPPVGAQITIRYNFGLGDVESFCQAVTP
jgi:hypothetical protein